jgi:hypothetical protein
MQRVFEGRTKQELVAEALSRHRFQKAHAASAAAVAALEEDKALVLERLLNQIKHQVHNGGVGNQRHALLHRGRGSRRNLARLWGHHANRRIP